MDSVDSKIIGIDKNRNMFIFTSRKQLSIAVAVYKKDYVDGAYYMFREKVLFSDRHTFRMEKQGHYRFIFEYTTTDEVQHVLVPPPDRNIAPPIPVRPEFPDMVMPTIPQPVDTSGVPNFPRIPQPPQLLHINLPPAAPTLSGATLPPAPELPALNVRALQLPTEPLGNPSFTLPQVPTAAALATASLPTPPVPPSPFNAQNYATALTTYQQKLSQYITAILNNGGVATDATAKRQAYYHGVVEKLTQYTTAITTAATAYKQRIDGAVATYVSDSRAAAQAHAVAVKAKVDSYIDSIKAALATADTAARQAIDSYVADLQQRVGDYTAKVSGIIDTYNREVITFFGEKLLYTSFMIDLSNKLSKFTDDLRQYALQKDKYNLALQSYGASVRLYEAAKEAYYKIDYPAQYTEWRSRAIDKTVAVGTTHVEEFLYSYYPDMLQHIVSGVSYVLAKPHDVKQLYNSKDNIAQTTITRMLYYNALVFNTNQPGYYGITLGALQETLRYHSGVYHDDKALCNIFMQEKYVIAAYYLAYLVEALRYDGDRDNVCATFNARVVLPLIKALNIDVDRIASHSGMILSNICKAKNTPPVVRDLTIDLHNRTTYTFSAAVFLNGSPPVYTDAEDDPPNMITLLSIPPQGVLKFKGTPVTRGQKIPFGEVDKLTYEPLNTDDTYIASFKFIIDDLPA